MAASTVVVHNFPSDGSYIARGVASSFNDGDTIATGLIKADGFMATANQADCVVGFTSQSAGVVTASAKTAGAAASGRTLYWVAWQLPTSS